MGEHALMLRNGEVNSKEEISEVVKSLNGYCQKHNHKYGGNADVPVYQAGTGECYVSAAFREEKHLDCTRVAPIGKQRLCWCHDESETAHASIKKSGSARDGASDDGKGGLSMALIIWIISGNMLFLGLAGMCFGIVRRFIKKGGSDVEEPAKDRPTDNGFYVRCPACGCPLGESRSLGNVSYQVTGTRAFRAGEDSRGTPSASPKYDLQSNRPSLCFQNGPSLGTSSAPSIESAPEPTLEEVQNS